MHITPNTTTNNASRILTTYPSILGFHYTIMQWIWVGFNLGYIDAYAVLEWANDTKLHTYHEHLIQSVDCVAI